VYASENARNEHEGSTNDHGTPRGRATQRGCGPCAMCSERPTPPERECLRLSHPILTSSSAEGTYSDGSIVHTLDHLHARE